MEKEFYATYQQLSDEQLVAPGESVVIRPNHGDTVPDEHALYMHSYRNFAYCQGNCRECQASGSICHLTQSTGPCTSCRSSEKACRTKTSKRYHEQSPQQCSKCLWRYPPKNPRPRHHAESCLGRCNRCEEHDLPCRIFSNRNELHPNLTGNADCILLLAVQREMCPDANKGVAIG